MLTDLGSIESILPDLPRDTIQRIAVAAASAGICSTELMQAVDFILRTLEVAELNRFGTSSLVPADAFASMLAHGDESVRQLSQPLDRPDTLRTLYALGHFAETLRLETHRIISRFEGECFRQPAEAAAG